MIKLEARTKRVIQKAAAVSVSIILAGILVFGFFMFRDSFFESTKMPKLVFDPFIIPAIWGIILVIMGAALFFVVWEKAAPKRLSAGFAFVLTLVPFWQQIFFEKQNPGATVIISACIIILTVYSAACAKHSSKTAFWLMAACLIPEAFMLLVSYLVFMMN